MESWERGQTMEAKKETPLYQIIIDDIQSQIEANNFDYDKPLCTEKSLCEKYKVSRITAKHALNALENSGLLYRKRGVGSFVAEPGNLRMTTDVLHKVFALLLPFNITQGGILRAVETTDRIFAKSGSQLAIYISRQNVDREKELLEYLLAQEIAGLVYYPWTSKLPLDLLDAFVHKNKPVIVLDKECPYKHITSIVCDNYQGSYMLTEHIASYGHTQTCYLSRFKPEELSSIGARYKGYCQCLANHRLTPRFVHWEPSGQGGYHLLKHLVNSLYLEGITAILCENDEVAFNVYMCCLSLGINIPNDMNITGFDNIDWATTGSAHITTIDQNFLQIGETIASVLQQESYSPVQYTVPVQLIPRFSTGKAKAKLSTLVD